MSMPRRIGWLLAFVAAFAAVLPVGAQLHRSARTTVRAGLLEKADTLRAKRDSIRMAGLIAEIDSITQADYQSDSVAVATLRTDDRHTLDSVALAQVLLGENPDTAARPKVFKKGWFMSDSMPISKVCWLTMVMPGYGQIYNKQYWKLPILYGTLGAGLAMYIHENKVYKPLKRQFEAYTDLSMVRTPELNALQTKMIQANTRRQLYLGLTVASYIYFIGDAAVSYHTNDVSGVKKATTLACIFPGAGQIYNKSYWKVPFVVGGFASMIYCIDWNNRGYQRFKKAYALLADYEANPDNYPNGSTDEFHGRYSASFIKNQRNNFRRNRDLCIILSGALYVLQIVDAHVDAHLKDYDISDDLAMNLEPMVDYTYVPTQNGNRPVFGFNLSLKF